MRAIIKNKKNTGEDESKKKQRLIQRSENKAKQKLEHGRHKRTGEQTNRRRVKEKSQTWIHRGWWTNNTQVSRKRTKDPKPWRSSPQIKRLDTLSWINLTSLKSLYVVVFWSNISSCRCHIFLFLSAHFLWKIAVPTRKQTARAQHPNKDAT